MPHYIKNPPLLTKILWLDAFMGGSCGIAGLALFQPFSGLFGLSSGFLIFISAVTFCYSIVAGILASQKVVSIPLLRVLVFANWAWGAFSVVMVFIHCQQATALGVAFLVLQIIVVGGLAYLEGRQIGQR